MVFGMDQPDFNCQWLYVVIPDKLGERQHILADFRQPFGKYLFGQIFPFHIAQQDRRDVIKVVTPVDYQRFELDVHKRSVCRRKVAFFRRAILAVRNHPIQQGGRRRHNLF